MWIEWNDPIIMSRTELLLTENGGEHDASELGKYEFFEVNGYKDLDRLEELNSDPEKELKIIQGHILVSWRRSDLHTIASFYETTPQESISPLRDEKDHQGYPLLIARLKKIK